MNEKLLQRNNYNIRRTKNVLRIRPDSPISQIGQNSRAKLPYNHEKQAKNQIKFIRKEKQNI